MKCKVEWSVENVFSDDKYAMHMYTAGILFELTEWLLIIKINSLVAWFSKHSVNIWLDLTVKT